MPPPRLKHSASASKQLPLEFFYPNAEKNNGLKVLVVDDDRAVCRAFCRQLQELGYTSLQLLNGTAALPAARQEKPDLILLDVNLGPHTDGFEICRQLKADEKARGLPVIMISGDATKHADQDRARRLGAAVYLLKPVTSAELQRALSATRNELQFQDGSAAQAAVRGKIVVVDDDPEWLSLTKRWLEEAGHKVVVLPRSADLIAAARREAPDCIILDFDLGDGTADAICRELRAQCDLNRVLLIGHTAHPDAKVRMLRQGADHFLQKATEPHELLATIEACLRRAHWDSGVLVAGDLRLDRSRREVVWKDVLSELSEEQFQFLYALVSRANQWVAKAALAAELHRDLTEQALNQLAFRLRKLLQPPLGRRVRFNKRKGWIYQSEPSSPSKIQ